MLNLPGSSFATSGFTNDPNVSPFNQTFSAAVLTVLARIGILPAVTFTLPVTISGNQLTINVPDNTNAIVANDTGPLASGIVALTIAHLGAQIGWLGSGGDSGGASLNDVTLACGNATGSLNLYTNGARRLVVASTGDVTINVPVSGNALTVNGLSGNGTQVWQSTGAAAASVFGWNTGFSGTAWNFYTQSTDNLAMGCLGTGAMSQGTVGNANWSVFTSNLTRATINGSGNVTINAPASGIALAVLGFGGASNPAISVNSGGASAPGVKLLLAGGGDFYQEAIAVPALAMNSNGANWGFVQNDAGNTWSLAYGSAASSGTLGTPALQWNSTPQILGRGPQAGALVDMTPDAATFTGTLTGVSSGGTGTVTFRRIGIFALLYFNFTGVSNTTSMTMTGLPAYAQVATAQTVPCKILNGSNEILGEAIFTAASGTISFSANTIIGSQLQFSSTAFTASGNKGGNNTVIIYSLL